MNVTKEALCLPWIFPPYQAGSPLPQWSSVWSVCSRVKVIYLYITTGDKNPPCIKTGRKWQWSNSSKHLLSIDHIPEIGEKNKLGQGFPGYNLVQAATKRERKTAVVRITLRNINSKELNAQNRWAQGKEITSAAAIMFRHWLTPHQLWMAKNTHPWHVENFTAYNESMQIFFMSNNDLE